MTTNELKSFDWRDIAFAEKGNNKILVLICSTKGNSDNFLNVLNTNEFNLNLTLNGETKSYAFQIDFVSGETIGLHTFLTENNYPQIKWAINQQLTHVTTGYRDENGKLQLPDYFHPFQNRLNLN